MELIKRIRRIKDGVMYPYSQRMAQSYGMEIVMCDAAGDVVEVVGEVGSLGAYGRQYVGTAITEEEAQKRLNTPSRMNVPSRAKASAPGVRTGRKGSKKSVLDVVEEVVVSDGPDNSDLS